MSSLAFAPALAPASFASRLAPALPHRGHQHGRTMPQPPARPLRAAPRAAPRAVAEPLPVPSAPPGPAADVPAAFSDHVMNTYARFPLSISHGAGAELFATDGTRYLDCVAGIATCTLGHANPAIVDAVSAQVRRVTHVSNLYYIPEQAQLAEWLVRNSPADKVFFCNSGGEANEAAIKLARKRWHLARNPAADPAATPVILTAEASFHGRTLATLTATGQPKYHANWWPLVPGFDYVRYNDPAHLRERAAAAGPNLAAILVEALQGEGGVRPATPEFMRAARDAADAADALLICDEVQVGMGRTGRLWGFDHTGVQPDAFTLAKGLAGGVPIGALCASARCDVFAPGDHASTFGGNPLATAAGLAVARELTDGGVLANAAERGAQLEAGLLAVAAKFPKLIREVRGKGLIRGVELNGISAADVVKRAMEKGVLLVPAGTNVVRFVPPLVITEEQVEEVVINFEEALKHVA